MEAKYRDILPAVVQRLVDEIEEHCGRELPVRQNPATLQHAGFRLEFPSQVLPRRFT
jgi:hypothetical protein